MRKWDSQNLRHRHARSENASPMAVERAGSRDVEANPLLLRALPAAAGMLGGGGDDSGGEADQGVGEGADETVYQASRVAASADWLELDVDEWELFHPSGYKAYVEDEGDRWGWSVYDGQYTSIDDGYAVDLDSAQQEAEAALDAAAPGPGATYSAKDKPCIECKKTGGKHEVWCSLCAPRGSLSARQRTAGYQSSNWRRYPEEEEEVVADYEDALDPSNCPKAEVVLLSGEYSVGVVSGYGEPVGAKDFYDLNEAIAWADKLLIKTYKGEAALDKGQGKFFTTPGKGKLFSNRTASRRTAMSMWDSLVEPRHKVAGWNWDDKLEGFVAEGASAHFSCVCGSNVEAPGYATCHCGKIWNAYTIAGSTGTQVVCREVPNRGAEVLLANKRTANKTASDDSYFRNLAESSKGNQIVEDDYATIQSLIERESDNPAIQRLIDEAKTSETAEHDYDIVQALQQMFASRTAAYSVGDLVRRKGDYGSGVGRVNHVYNTSRGTQVLQVNWGYGAEEEEFSDRELQPA